MAPKVSPDQQRVVEDAIMAAQIADIQEAQGAAQGQPGIVTVTSQPIGSKGEGTDISKQEYVTVYNTLDGRPKELLPSQLTGKLGLRWRDHMWVPENLVGTKIWSLEPVETPDREFYKCLLHADDPNADMYRGYGITTICRKHNFGSKMAIRQHMAGRHETEWAIIQEERTSARNEGRDATQQQVLDAIIGLQDTDDKD